MEYTIEQIGARARAKNPSAFSKYSDEQIGKRLVETNPSIAKLLKKTETPAAVASQPLKKAGQLSASEVSAKTKLLQTQAPEQKSELRQVLSGAGKFLGETAGAVAGIPEQLSRLPGIALRTATGKGTLKDAYNAYTAPTLAGKTLGDIEQLAGKEIGSFSEANTPLQQWGKTATGVASSFIPVGPKGTSAAETVGKVGSKAGEAIRSSVNILRPTKIQGEQLIGEAAGTAKNIVNSIAKTAEKYGLSGTEKGIATKAKSLTNSLWNKEVKPALESAKAVIDKNTTFKEMESAIKSLNNEALKQEKLIGLDYLKNAYKNVKGWDLPTAQKLKEELVKTLPEATWKGKPIANTLKSLNNELSSILRREISDNIPSKAKEVYANYGNLLEIAKRGGAALSQNKAALLPGSVVTQALSKLSTPLLTKTGGAISQVGKGLQNITKLLKGWK